MVHDQARAQGAGGSGRRGNVRSGWRGQGRGLLLRGHCPALGRARAALW